MRIVIDTNIWVSGLLKPHSSAGQVIEAWKNGHYHLIISKPILDEIRTVLAYPKINKRLKWDEEKIDHFILTLEFLSDCITLEYPLTSVKRDAKDDIILSTFLQGKANYLVTGDEDLLSMKHQYEILSLIEFCSLL